MRFPRLIPSAGRTRRMRGAVGLVLGAILTAGVGFSWARRDPWPARLVIRLPQSSWIAEITGDGRSLVTNGPGGALVYSDLATGALQPTPPSRIMTKAYSRDRRTFVGVEMTAQGWTSVVWGDASSGAIRRRFATDPFWATCPTFEPGERSVRALVGTPNFTSFAAVVTWDLASGAETRRPFNGPSGREPQSFLVLASLDGRILVFDDRGRTQIQLWDLVTDRPLGAPIPGPDRPPSNSLGVGLSDDGRTLALARAGGRVEVWDVAPTGARLVRTLRPHSSGFATDEVAVAPDGRSIASSAILATGWTAWYHQIWGRIRSRSARERWEADYETVVTDLATGRARRRLQGALDARFTPDGRSIVTREAEGAYAVRDVPLPDPPAP